MGALLLFTGLVSFGYTAYKMGASIPALLAFLFSPPILHCLLNSNIEWLPLLGFVLPPQIGLFFVTIKPQIGLGVILFWLVESCRKGGVKEVTRVFLPITILAVISFILFGFWPIRFLDTMNLTRSYNASLWPSTIPVGLTLLVASFRRREIRYAIGASPCLSPYVLFHAWSGALVSISHSTAETIVAAVGLWALVIIRSVTGGL